MLLNNGGVLMELFVLLWRRSWCLHHFLFGKACFFIFYCFGFYFKQPDFLKHFILKNLAKRI